MCPGNPFGDDSQRAVMLALIFKPVLTNEDGVRVPAPLAHQCRAGLWGDTGIERPAFVKFSGQGLQAPPQCPACPAGSTLLQMMDEASDQQVATEPLRRAGAMQLAPDKPQFGCRPIEQLANLTLELGGIRTVLWVASVAEAAGNGRRLARELASRRVVGRGRHTLACSLIR